MKCPSCQHLDSRVVDSRTTGEAIRRRRQCLGCAFRFTTHERVEWRMPWVVKRDGRREPYNREKVLAGVALACRRRPVSLSGMEEVTQRVELRVGRGREEVSSVEVGRAVVAELRRIDAVAYIRFASVYEAFENVEQFTDAIRPLSGEDM